MTKITGIKQNIYTLKLTISILKFYKGLLVSLWFAELSGLCFKFFLLWYVKFLICNLNLSYQLFMKLYHAADNMIPHPVTLY